MKIEKENNNLEGVYFAYYGLGGIALKKNNYKNAETKLVAALKLAEQIGEPSGIAIVSNELGLLYREMKQYQKSLVFFQSSIKNSESIELNNQKLESYKEIALTYYFLNDFKNAYKFQADYIYLYEKINNFKINNRISELQSNFERKQAEQENYILIQEKKKQELISGYNYNIRNFLIIIVVLILIITFSRTKKLNEITNDKEIRNNKPFLLNLLLKKNWIKSFVIAIYFVLFFLFVQPYIIREISVISKMLFLISFGFSIFILLIIVLKINSKIQLRYSSFESIFNQILIFGIVSILMISLFAEFYLNYIISESIINIKFFDILIEVIIASMLPLFFILFIYERNLFNVQQTKILNLIHLKTLNYNAENSRDISAIIEKSNAIIIKSEVLKQQLSLNIDDLICVEANDNYSAVYFMKNNKLSKELIRITLKGIENQLSEFNEIIRCHKSYLVNYSKVLKIIGSSQEYKFLMSDLSFEVPISRKFPKELLELHKEKQ